MTPKCSGFLKPSTDLDFKAFDYVADNKLGVLGNKVLKDGIKLPNDFGFELDNDLSDAGCNLGKCTVVDEGAVKKVYVDAKNHLTFENNVEAGYTGKFKVSCSDGTNTMATNEFTVTQNSKCHNSLKAAAKLAFRAHSYNSKGWAKASESLDIGISLDNGIGFSWGACPVDVSTGCSVIENAGNAVKGYVKIESDGINEVLYFSNDVKAGWTGKYKVECTDGENKLQTPEFAVTQSAKCATDTFLSEVGSTGSSPLVFTTVYNKAFAASLTYTGIVSSSADCPITRCELRVSDEGSEETAYSGAATSISVADGVATWAPGFAKVDGSSAIVRIACK